LQQRYIVDGLLAFWVLSAVFAVVGTAVRGLIRPISWATLAIATLFMAPGKITETVNAVREGEMRLALPELPPPPSSASKAISPTAASTDPVPLDPNATPTSTITTPPPDLANKGWADVNDAVLPALQTDASTPSNNNGSAPTDANGSTASRSIDPVPPVSGLW
jgi:hypothetical protein